MRVECRDLSPTDIKPAVELLARAMCDNPVLVRAFGADAVRRQRRLTRYYSQVVPLTLSKGGFLGAFLGGNLVGVAGTLRPGCCRPRFREVLRFVPSLVANNRPSAVLRIKRWQDAWGRHDLPEVHWHVGLLAVDSQVQGMGVGTRLMAEHCVKMDRLAATSYLETDRAQNVRFYQRFGFQIVSQAPVLGVTNWFMKRTAAVPVPTIAAPARIPSARLVEPAIQS